MITLRNINKSFNSGKEITHVIHDLSINFGNQEFTTIVGPNGCGKSTLLNLVAGLIKPDLGTIEIDSHENPKIGYVWQDYRSTLLPWLTIGENITFPLKIAGKEFSVRFEAAERIMEDFKLNIDVKKKIYNLSGGQQQLVCLLRSIVSDPDIMLLDEPFSALDQPNRWTMAFNIEKNWMRKKKPVIFVSHDVDEAILLADKIILMAKNGGAVAEIIKNDLPRPRNVKMMQSKQHIIYRNKVIDFLFNTGAIRDYSTNGN